MRENAFSVRLDHRFSPNWNFFVRYFSDRGTNDQPEGVTGRLSTIKADPQNAVLTLQGVLSPTILNEARIGYNAAKTSIAGSAPTVNGIDFSQLTINTSGSIANTGDCWAGRFDRHCDSGRPAAPEQRRQRPRHAIPAVLAVAHRHAVDAEGAAQHQVRR